MADITREEQFLSAAAGNDVNLPTPITREEMYLAKAAGVNINITMLDPITRKEKYLAALAESGGGGSSVDVEPLSVTENGTTTAPSGKAYSPVVVNVPNSYSAGDEGKVVSNGALVAQSSDTVTANDTYDTTLINSLTVNVPTSGGGLEYEMGVYTPTADIARPEIYFTNQHSAPPMFLMIADVTDSKAPATSTNYAEVYGNWATAFGKTIEPDTSPTVNDYGLISVLFDGGAYDAKPLIRTDSTSASNSTAYWVNNEYFKPSTMSNSRYWKAGRTYKWIAVFAPES